MDFVHDRQRQPAHSSVNAPPSVASREPRRVATVALVSKTSRRSSDTEPHYSGFEIGDELIYGYGLDWNERYRDLPFIALANP